MIRLIASDIDGTLLPEGASQLDPVYFDRIFRLKRCGIRFAAASGRQYTNLRRLFAPVADEIDYICENGALVVSGGAVLSKTVIERSLAKTLLRRLLDTPGCEPLASGVYTGYIQPKDPAYARHLKEQVKNDVTVVENLLCVPEDLLKIAAYFKSGVTPEIQEAMNRVAAPEMRAVASGLPWLDFLQSSCNKGTALRTLQAQFGIKREETMAFGDNENDIELLEQAGIGCAMAGGHPKLRGLGCRIVTNAAEEITRLLEEVERCCS